MRRQRTYKLQVASSSMQSSSSKDFQLQKLGVLWKHLPQFVLDTHEIYIKASKLQTMKCQGHELFPVMAQRTLNHWNADGESESHHAQNPHGKRTLSLPIHETQRCW